MTVLLAVVVPNPVDWIPNPFQAAGDAVTDAGAAVLSSIGDAIIDGLADAASAVSSQLLDFISNSATVRFDAGWWAGDRAQQVVGVVLQFSAVLMVGFLLLALLQGLLQGDAVGMLRSALLEVPVSVLGTVSLVAVTSLLLGLTDAASAMVLDNAPVSLERFFSGFGQASNIATAGAAGAIMVIVFLLGALFVWIELVVRSALLYLLIAFAPLTLAARVWPATRGVFRKLCELGVALIVSKFAIALALALGAAALGGGGPEAPEASAGAAVGLDLAGLLGGATLMLLAAFTPFVLLRLLPVFEAAVVAQGISRSPGRAATAGMQGAYYGSGIKRMANGGAGRSASPPGAGGGESAGGPPSGGPSGPGAAGPPTGAPGPAATPPSGASAMTSPAAVPVGLAAAGAASLEHVGKVGTAAAQPVPSAGREAATRGQA